ncbi:entericidin A/B family lipoprotein [Eleftheria terrae]|uniref:entericidin A/B family lipoprotein n=1 Tax=Eleftheria terrae TaxID=1597781 RepID=UPI00263AAEE5|nr:entericidin A/B family lipoprotein [Eleftheria terrae]WKB50927.1 entericidin A/B family lipoprotein [Eleftheria terrae]
MKTRFLTLLSALMAAMFTLSACNTMQGVGKDVERGGEKLQDKAQETKKKM